MKIIKSFTGISKQQLLDGDIGTITPNAYYELVLETKDCNIELIPIFITVSYIESRKIAKQRGSFNEWKLKYEEEDKEYKDFEFSNSLQWRVLNFGAMKDTVSKVVNIIHKVNTQP